VARDRYELQISRLDGNRLRRNVDRITEFLDLSNNEQFERVCAQHFVPMAAAAAGEQLRRRRREMPWLSDYVLHIYRPGVRSSPECSSRSMTGWED
jgi:hypothetical protein